MTGRSMIRNRRNERPLVWYVAAGYGLPAGIEAHILHYATELRNHGFNTCVMVFRDLPRPGHRFLAALRERGIPISALESLARWRIAAKTLILFVPWFLYILFYKRRWPNIDGFVSWVSMGECVRELGRQLTKEQPDIIHVFGRLWTESWAVLPADRTIFHEMMTGTVDNSWTGSELEDFHFFAENIARVFAPGKGVADNLKSQFGITRPIDVVFTMTPEEAGSQWPVNSKQSKNGGRNIRFGILCRFTEQKGIKYLLEALKQYRDRYGDVDFTFAGQGMLEGMIREFIDANQLKNVRIVRVNSATDILNKLDVFVHPSLEDAMPVALAEALMCGVPCIASRVGGIPDLIRDGLEGVLIEPRCSDQILSAMEKFSGMTVEELGSFRQRARARYEAVCTPEKVGKVVAGHYREIIKTAKADEGKNY